MPVMPSAEARAGARADAVGQRDGDRLADRAVLGDQRRRHARERRLGVVAVGDGAAEHVRGAARQRRSSATSTGRRCTTPPPQIVSPRSRSSAPTTSSIDRPSVLNTSRPSAATSSSRAARSRVGCVGLRILRAQRQMQLHLARHREDRRLDRRRLARPPRVDRLRDLLDVRFAAAGDEERRLMNARTPRRAPPSGAAHNSSNIGCSSRGGPGSSTTTRAVVAR